MQHIHKHGINAIGLAIPSHALPLSELAKINNVAVEQYVQTLGCQSMSLCVAGENVVSLAIRAAQRAVYHWGGKLEDIGLVVVATETAIDMSRPLSSWVMSSLGLRGNVRSYEVKHACYGGTAALRQAMEWRMSGNNRGKVALVVAADVALYARGHSGEPTQGAGAVAMIVGDAVIAGIDCESFYWSDPQFDFWRPVGNLYPEVNGRLSLSCYLDAVLGCFGQIGSRDELLQFIEQHKYLAFHVPFPKMVQKAVKKLADYVGLDLAQGNQLYDDKVVPTMQWNQQIGNSYTASLWFAVANVLTKGQAFDKFAAFSYGSGCGAELLSLEVVRNQANAAWVEEFQQDLVQRTMVDAEFYLREVRGIKEILTTNV